MQNNSLHQEKKHKQIIHTYHFCTYFDRNYITRGLALYKSLITHCKHPFILWILCFDDETFNSLSQLNLPKVRLITQGEFEGGDDKLLLAKSERSQVEYYWTCTSSLLLYVFHHNPEVEIITYLDADLYFFSDPQPIYEEFGNNSILIIEHRFPTEYAYMAENSGIYNVGYLSFRRDTNGLTCLEWWRERCLEWCSIQAENGKFGDQKYLDDWPSRFSQVVVLQYHGAGLAPWNLRNHKFVFDNQSITIDGNPLIFFHFHNFKVMSNNLVRPLLQPYVVTADQAIAIYLPYACALKDAANLYQNINHQELYSNISWKESIIGIFCHRYLIVEPVWISRIVWQMSNIMYNINNARIDAAFEAFSSGDMKAAYLFILKAILLNPFLVFKLTRRLFNHFINRIRGTYSLLKLHV